MGVMTDQDGNIVSGRNDQYNFNFIGKLTYPNDGNDRNKTNWTSMDGGISFPDNQYYDIYKYGENNEFFSRRILGDATGEMGTFTTVSYRNQNRSIGSWYADEAWFINSGNPWFRRSSHAVTGSDTGIFVFANATGFVDIADSFRIILTPVVNIDVKNIFDTRL